MAEDVTRDEEEIPQTTTDEEALFDMSDEELEELYKGALADPEGENSAVANEEEDQPEDDEVDEPEDDEPEDEGIEEEESTDDEEEESDEDSDEDEAEEDTANEDGDSEEKSEDENKSENEKTGEKANEKVEKFTYKANGQEFEFTLDEIKEKFGKVFAQSMNYTQKMQAIAPYRKMISAMEEENISQDDMNLMIDALKGSKEAIATIVKKTGVDVLDLDVEGAAEGYRPKEYGRDERELALKEVIDEISRDPEYDVTYNVIDRIWDDRSRQEFAARPELIKGLHTDVKTGVFDKVSPIAAKLKVYDGGRKSDIEYYIEAGRQYYAELNKSKEQEIAAKQREAALEREKAEEARLAEIKAKDSKRRSTKTVAKKRKAAGTTPTRAGKKKVTDYLDDSDEAFEEWYKALQEKM